MHCRKDTRITARHTFTFATRRWALLFQRVQLDSVQTATDMELKSGLKPEPASSSFESQKPFRLLHSGIRGPSSAIGGGIQRSFPTLLTFDYDNEVDLKRWDGISSYHDFELHEDSQQYR
jgi:hypothetical protein